MKFKTLLPILLRSLLPAPFTIAVVLTIITLALAYFLNLNNSKPSDFFQLLEFWEKGVFDGPLTIFSMQMMLMLVLGHALATTKSISWIINLGIKNCNTNQLAATTVSIFSLILSLFNWGLGLVFGAIFAKRVAEYASKNHIKINYPLIGAAGYSGLMVWHGGLSGSAPLKIAEKGHFLSDQIGVIPLSSTIFSPLNFFTSFLLLSLVPLAFYLLGKATPVRVPNLSLNTTKASAITEKQIFTGAEKLDNSPFFSKIFAGFLLASILVLAFSKPSMDSLSFLTPNFINLLLLTLGVFLHKNLSNFVSSVDEAIRGAAGILIQFPLYFGIMGIMKHSGLATSISDYFVSISNVHTFPIFTFISSAILNVFIPSGGGQWAIQGPIIVNAANQLGISIEKCVMALAYGDQLTNMMQPFWALPLLGITGLKAKEILPFSLLIMLLGGTIFTFSLLLF